MRKLSGLTGFLLVTFAFMVAPVAQAGNKDTSQAPGILPSGCSDAVDRDVMAPNGFPSAHRVSLSE